MDVAYTRACGIDVHQKSVSVSLLIGDFDTNRPKRTNRKYDTTTNSLKALACWLVDLTRVGMIEPSYIPELSTIELRESTRLRKNLIQQLTVIKNEIHNILQRSNIKLHWLNRQ